MADWKEMYLSLMKDSDKAIRILEQGQEKCEEMFLREEGLLPDADSSQVQATDDIDDKKSDNSHPTE
jgi:hypothetical protein